MPSVVMDLAYSLNKIHALVLSDLCRLILVFRLLFNLSVYDRLFLFARSNLPNVLISKAKKFFP